MNLLLVAGLSALTVLVLMSGVALSYRRTGVAAVVDAVWGPGFVLIALVSALSATAFGDGAALGWVLFVLVAIWGGRLGWHILRRSRGQGEDPRYEKLLADGGGLLRKVLLPQGLAMWFVSLPVQVAAATASSDIPMWTYVVLGVGIVVWAAGLAFEAIGDAQLAAYKRDPDRGRVMDRGLWAWTRHPNYFGDAVVWWGIWLAAAATSGWAALTVLSPVAMTFFLRNVTGAKLLERTMMQRPGFPEYAERVPMFFPRPPRRST